MFGIGFGELILLFVIALIVFGPEKLPEVARTLGKYYKKFTEYTDSLKDTFEKELQLEELKKELNLEEFKKLNNIPKEVTSLVLPKEEVEKRKREVLKRLKEKKELENKDLNTEDLAQEESDKIESGDKGE